MTATYSKELVEYEEQIADAELADINHQLAILSSKTALTTLQKATTIEFNPAEDVEVADNLLEKTISKFNQVATINVVDRLEEEYKDILIGLGDDEVSAKLVPTKSAFMQELVAEKAVATTLKLYADIITKLLKEKRMLSGQAYGSQAQQTSSVPRLIQIRKSMMKLQNGNNATLTIPVNELNPKKAVMPTIPAPSDTFPKD